jgi:hypothetical protein
MFPIVITTYMNKLDLFFKLLHFLFIFFQNFSKFFKILNRFIFKIFHILIFKKTPSNMGAFPVANKVHHYTPFYIAFFTFLRHNNSQ